MLPSLLLEELRNGRALLFIELVVVDLRRVQVPELVEDVRRGVHDLLRVLAEAPAHLRAPAEAAAAASLLVEMSAVFAAEAAAAARLLTDSS